MLLRDPAGFPADPARLARVTRYLTRRGILHSDARGLVAYHGPSLIDGSPIVLLACSHASANVKMRSRRSGRQVFQTYILRADMSPMRALDLLADRAICGDCPHRKRWDADLGRYVRSCYVLVSKSVQSAWDSWACNRYAYPSDVAAPTSERDELLCAVGALGGRVGPDAMLRLGAYGDPAAVPRWVWEALLRAYPAGHTGYTHQWRAGFALQDLCMASVDSSAERARAKAEGWRTARTIADASELEPGEIVCPAQTRDGVGCADCRLCDGRKGDSDKRADIAFLLHGSGATRAIKVRKVHRLPLLGKGTNR